MRKKRVSSKQKRIRPAAPKTVKPTSTSSKAKILKKALHLLLGSDHFRDRAAAERLRQFPNVPRKRQKPFPRDVEIGFVGHYKKREFAIQDDDSFVAEYVANSEKAYYFRNDKRGNREPRKEVSGLVETNAALSTGLSMVLAGLVEKGETGLVKNIMLLAAKAGMMTLEKRSRYKPAFLALHPDWEGTMSVHFGLWPVDPVKHVLIGISATGKVGKKGLRTLGDSFTSVLRHDRALIHGGKDGLSAGMLKRPKKNLKERDPDDWAVAEEMDRVVMEELAKLPEGPELLKQAEEYQLEAAEDWLKRYNGSKAGVDRKHAEMEQTKATIAALEATVKEGAGMLTELQSVLKMILALPGIEGLLRSVEDLWERVVALAKSVGLFLNPPEPVIVESGTGTPVVDELVVVEPAVVEVVEATVGEPAVGEFVVGTPIAENPLAEGPESEETDVEEAEIEEAVVEGFLIEEPAAEEYDSADSAATEPAAVEPVKVMEATVVEATVGEPAVGEFVVGTPITEKPLAKGPEVEEAEVEELMAGGFVIEEPAVKEPAAEEPVEEPATEEPATEEPATEEPATEAPAAEKPAAEKPAAEKPVAERPAAKEPAAEEPTVKEPYGKEAVAEKSAVEVSAFETASTEEEISEGVPARVSVATDSMPPPEPNLPKIASDQGAPQAANPAKPKPWKKSKIIWANDKDGPGKGG